MLEVEMLGMRMTRWGICSIRHFYFGNSRYQTLVVNGQDFPIAGHPHLFHLLFFMFP